MATARAFTDKEIQDYLKATYNIDPGGQSFIDNTKAKALYTDALNYGIKEDQLDKAMGWNAGTSANWIKNAGLDPLTKPATNTTSVTADPNAALEADKRAAAQRRLDEQKAWEMAQQAKAPAAQPPAAQPATNTTPLFDPKAYTDSLKEMVMGFKDLFAETNKTPEIKITMPEPFKPTAEMLANLSAENRIPKLLTGETAKAAGANAMGQANARGLLNSSMAVEAANSAMIANAADIASGDANRYGSLLATGLNNDAAMSRLITGGQINAQLEGIRNNNDFNNMLFKTGASMLESNINWNRELARSQMNNAREDAVYARNRGDVLADRADLRAYEGTIYDRTRTDAVADRQAGWDRADSVAGAARDEALQTAYTSAVAKVESQLSERISAIQASDLPPDVKEAQIKFEIGWAQTRVTMANAMFSNMPGWRSEWSQLELDIPTGG